MEIPALNDVIVIDARWASNPKTGQGLRVDLVLAVEAVEVVEHESEFEIVDDIAGTVEVETVLHTGWLITGLPVDGGGNLGRRRTVHIPADDRAWSYAD